MSREQVNRNVKASVFSDFFGNAENQFELYKVLHPEDHTSTSADITDVTLTNTLVRVVYNDLGFTLGKKRIILVEAQSTWTSNIIPRCILYMAESWTRYTSATKQNVYGKKKVKLPEPELYVIYTGTDEITKKEISLSEEFFDGRQTAIEARVKVITHTHTGTIIDQYIEFCQIWDAQRKAYPEDPRFAIEETLKTCIEKNILQDYLVDRRKELVDIMLTLFSQEEAYKMDMDSIRDETREEALEEGREEGREEGFRLAEKEFEAQKMEMAQSLFQTGMDISYIAGLMKLPETKVKAWLNA